MIYEVNLHVDEDIAAVYAEWLEAHIREMLAFDGFEGALWYEVEDGADGRRHWTVQYHVADRAALDDYFLRHADRMRRVGLDRFGGRFSADRRILQERRTFEHRATP